MKTGSRTGNDMWRAALGKVQLGLEALKERASPEGHYLCADGFVEGNPVEVVQNKLIQKTRTRSTHSLQMARRIVSRLEFDKIIEVRRDSLGHVGCPIGVAYRLTGKEEISSSPQLAKIRPNRSNAQVSSSTPKATSIRSQLTDVSVEDLIKAIELRFQAKGLSVQVVIATDK